MNFSVLLTASGKVFSSGMADNGRLGLGELNSRYVTGFKEVEYFSKNTIEVKEISVGGRNVLAWTEKEAFEVGPNETVGVNSLYAWGSNTFHECGLGHKFKQDCWEP